jgi:RNA polymerase sigma factor (sigma-70 family)
MPADAAVLVQHIRRLAGGPAAEVSDRELLRHYTARRDEAAFAALVRRHGPMVWRACRRLLRQEQDAEDVYQATFLVLAKKADAQQWQDSVAGWLYGVAVRLAHKARCRAARRPAAVGAAGVAADPLDSLSGRELLAALDEELAGLAEEYRTPLLLCNLEGRTQEDAARQLGCSLSTVRRRLEVGRGLLHGRLSRRGLSLSALLGGWLLARSAASAAAPPALAAGQAPAAAAQALADGFLRGSAALPVRLAGACLLLAGLVAGAFGLAGPRAEPPAAPPEPPPAPAKGDEKRPPVAEPAVGQDAPLPAGVMLRAGLARFRHGSVVTSLGYSADGKLIATGGWDSTVRVWEAATGKEVQTIALGARTRATISPDGKRVASAGNDMIIRVHDVATGKELRAIAAHGQPIIAVAFSPDGNSLATAGQEGNVGLWDLVTGKSGYLAGHEGEVRSVAFSPDGKLLASAGADGTVRLWDPANRTEVARLSASSQTVLTVAFSADGKRLASGGVDKVVRLWDVADRKEVRAFEGHTGAVSSVAFAPDGKRLASASGIPNTDRTVRLWDVETGKMVRQLPGDFFGTVAFSPDGKTLAVAPGNAGIHLYDPETGKELPQSEGPMIRSQGVVVSPDGKLVATAGVSNYLIDTATGRVLRQFGPANVVSYTAAFAPDGKVLATGGRDGKIRLWDVAGGQEIRVMDGHKDQKVFEGWINSVVYSPDGKRLAEACRDGTVGLWDPATGVEQRRLTAHEGKVWSLAWSPDGKTFVTGGADLTVRLWDAASGNEVRRLEGHNSEVEAVAWSPDGRLIASADRAGEVRLWGAATGQLLHQLKEQPRWTYRLNHHADGRTIAFSPDGRLLAAGNWEAVQVWESATGRERARFVGHRGEVNALAFAPDSRTLVTGGFDGTVLFWDVTGRRRDGKLPPAALPPQDLEAEWTALRGEDGPKAHRAVWALAADARQALPLLKERLTPVPAADEKKVARLIAALDDDDFDTREKATQELAGLAGAETQLRKALEGMPSAEVRERVRYALDARERQVSSPEWAVTLRCLEVLEQMGTPEARDWLRALADGEPGAALTAEAKAALRRIGAAPRR